jgi:ATP-dependent Lon protease
VTAGLAWTAVGGRILFVEAVAMPGAGSVRLTGQLGNVMQESAQAAISYIRSRYATSEAEARWFRANDVHIHLPAGAVPKDGPSAGVALATSLMSLYRRIPVHHRVAMTGEISLTGEVLPIGGLTQKVLAAHRVGMTDVVLPAANERDLDEIPEEVTASIHFHPVERVEEAWDVALTRDFRERP